MSAACFSAGPIEVAVLGAELGQASALKMCYAGLTKGTNALRTAVLLSGEMLGVNRAVPIANDLASDQLLAQSRQFGWEQGRAPILTASPLAAGNVVFMNSAFGLAAVDLQSGKRLWRLTAEGS